MDEFLIRELLEDALSGLGDDVVADARLLGGESAFLRVRSGRSIEHTTQSDLRLELRASGGPTSLVSCSTNRLDADGSQALGERAHAALGSAPSDLQGATNIRWLAPAVELGILPRRAQFDDNLVDSGPAYRIDLIADALLAIEARGWTCDATVAHCIDGAELDGPSTCAGLASSAGHFAFERSSWARTVVDIRATPQDPRLLWRQSFEGFSRSKARAELEVSLLDRLEPLIAAAGSEAPRALDTVPLNWVLSEWAMATLWRSLGPLFIGGGLGFVERNIGQAVSFKGLDVKLDPEDSRVRGRSFDVLGTASKALPLIESGLAVALLHDRQTLETLGREPQGFVVDPNDGRAEPRDWVVGGVDDVTLWDLLVDVEDGLFWLDLQAKLSGDWLTLSAPSGVWQVEHGSLRRVVTLPPLRVEASALLAGIRGLGQSRCALGGAFPPTLLTLTKTPETKG
ncbi:MAG: hypothetical protein AUK47_21735 [Deltaproteobacteria bacterium CG2_30_63_29]|nr:MAG: hypothetical protein AUK47_21735 [Deltaproteobacteria bacterium CG2_30_63_29]PJB46594.1 MAG: hypothetical protein CO108_05665 [Deltaproteobacteria bacterium CG_4_9_14_3_um_filter_63_12]